MYIVKYLAQVHMVKYARACEFYNIRLITFLAHLSQRLIGELIVYSCSGVRPSYVVIVVRRRPQFQASSSPKPLARSKANFMWSLLG